MKIFKKLLSFAMAVSLSVTAVSAAGGFEASARLDELVYTAGDYSASEIKLMEKLRTAIKNFDESPIDISAYNLSYTEFEKLYGAVVLNEPEFFYVSTISAYMEYETKDHILSVAPVYRYGKNSAASMQKKIDQYTNKLLEGIEDDWTDAEKVLYVHDYIASSAVYYEGSNTSKGRSIYDTFIKGDAVCVGYSLGFQYIMDILEIPCICITSETHIWNMVQIGSNWYHLDATWDDTEFDSPNFVFHNMTLLSEYGIDNAEPPHEPWDYAMTADSSIYDDYFWTESCSAMEYYNGWWYYTTPDGLCRYSFKKDRSEVVHAMNDIWMVDDEIGWTISFGKVQQINGSIYFNSPHKIYRYSPAENKTYLVSKPSIPSNYQIYDINYENGALKIYSSDDFEDMGKNITSLKISSKSTSSGNKKSATAPKVTDNGSTITVSWAENPNAEQYVLYRYNKTTKKTTKIHTTVNTEVTFKKTSKDDNCLYAIKVRTDDGLGKYSGWASAK